jgi:hypothetical protein
MSPPVVVLQGIIRPDGTLDLAEKVSLPAGRVQVTVQPLADMSQDPFWKRMEAIWSAQQARGHTARSPADVEAERTTMRDETEEEIQAAMRLQESSREARRQSNDAQTDHA